MKAEDPRLFVSGDAAAESGAFLLDFLSLEEAASELRATPQGVVLLARQHGVEVRRLERQGRTLSGLSRAELDYLAGFLEHPDAERRPEDLREQLLASRRQLEETRLELEVGREACQRLAQETARSEALEGRIEELTVELKQARDESAAHPAEVADYERRLAALEARREADAERAERALAKERERAERAQAERRVVEGKLANELARIDGLRRKLAAAAELEAANPPDQPPAPDGLSPARHRRPRSRLDRKPSLEPGQIGSAAASIGSARANSKPRPGFA